MKKLFITLILILFAICTIQAQEKIVTIDNQTPGWLSSKLTYDEQVAVEELTVTGYINKADMAFINSLIKNRNLKALNLYGAKLRGVDGADDKTWKGFLNPGTDKTMRKVVMPKYFTGHSGSVYSIDAKIDTLEVLMTEEYDGSFSQYIHYAPSFLKVLEGTRILKGGFFCSNNQSFTVSLPSTLKKIGSKAFSGNITFTNPHILPDSIEQLGENGEKYSSWWIQKGDPTNIDIPISPSRYDFPESLVSYHAGFHQYNGWSSKIIDHTYISDTIVVGKLCDTLAVNLKASVAYFMSKTPPENDGGYYNMGTLYVPKGCVSAYQKEYTSLKDKIQEVKSIETITIYPEKISLSEKETYKLSATVMPVDAFEKRYEWSCSDESVISIAQDGTITAIKPGKATIYATSVENGNVYGSCEITVIQPVTGVTMSQSSLNFSNIGETEQLKAIVEPEDAENKNVTWESSNKSVCSVSSNGTVVALSYGKSVVTATTEDGGYVAVCVVTVSEETPDPDPTVVSVAGVSLNVSEVTMTAVGDSYQLQASISPADATNKNVIWKSSNPEVCNVSSNGTVIALSYGSSTVSVTTEDGNFIATCSISVEEPTPDPSVEPLGETEMLLEEISAKKTYVLYNEYYDVYAVYDEVNSTSDVWTTSKTVDASSLGSSWMFFSKDNQYFLYNIGAQKYLLTPNTNLGMVSCTFSDNSEQCRLNIVELGNGRFAFSTNESEKGYMCAYMSSAGRVVNWTSSDNGSAWQFKENPNVAADTSVLDKTVTGIGESILIRSFGSSIYTIDGVKLNITDPSQLEKGVYIVDGKKVIVK